MAAGLADALIEAASAVRSMTTRVAARPTFEDFCHEAARQVRALTEFDRVMVYRFAHDGAGEMIAESVRPGIGSFLGQRYPAQDIPFQARALYERSWLRIIADIDAEVSPIDLEDMLTRLGVKHVTVASSVAQAMDALAEDMPPFAILDVNLGSETSFPVADALREAGMPFAFGTGFGDSAAFPERFRDVLVVQKPYSAESVAALF